MCVGKKRCRGIGEGYLKKECKCIKRDARKSSKSVAWTDYLYYSSRRIGLHDTHSAWLNFNLLSASFSLICLMMAGHRFSRIGCTTLHIVYFIQNLLSLSQPAARASFTRHMSYIVLYFDTHDRSSLKIKSFQR